MSDLAQHVGNLTETHLFYLAVLTQVVALVNILFIGFSHPPGKTKPPEAP